MIAFLGMGLLGSNFVKALLRNGNDVKVWNRTYERALPLEQAGAVVCRDILDAVKGAARVHITLRDDASVNEVLAAAEAGLSKDSIIIDHTTTSAEGAAERTAAWKAKGITYLHAPVFMGPQNALESTGTMLVSGDQQVIETVEPMLATMTGRVMNFGEIVNRAAGMKLLGNLFLIAMTGGIADMLALAGSLGIPDNDVMQLFNNWNPGGMVPIRLQRIFSGNFQDPSWELVMSRKDARLMMEGAADRQMHVIPAIAALMDEWISKGFGNNDWTIIASGNVKD